MNQLSNLTPSGSRSWLRSVHEQKKKSFYSIRYVDN